jgi:hypothetical protein
VYLSGVRIQSFLAPRSFECHFHAILPRAEEIN